MQRKLTLSQRVVKGEIHMKRREESIKRLGMLDGLHFGTFAVVNGFMPAYFVANGLSNTGLSITMAALNALGFVGAFFWGRVCDRRETNKGVYTPVYLAATAAVIVSYLLTRVDVMLGALVFPLYGFFSLGSSLDAWMMRAFSQAEGGYGRARSMGSFGYAIMMLVAGWFIAGLGYASIPIMLAILSLPIFALVLTTRETPYEKKGASEADSAASEKGGSARLFHIAPFITLLAVVLLCGLAISPVNNLKTVILSDVGGDVSWLGIDGFAGVMVQGAFVLASTHMASIPAHRRLRLMCVLITVSFVCTLLANGPALVVVGTIFYNASYGIMLPAMREMTEGYVPDDLRTTAHSLTDAAHGAAASSIALLYSGFMMDGLGVSAVLALGIALSTTAFVITLTMGRRSVCKTALARKRVASDKRAIAVMAR